MNDRELLEAAARAAGYGEVIYLSDEDLYALAWTPLGKQENEWRFWNPLENDGDAFCLMVDLKMKIRCIGTHEKVRRAIVSVAAQMVKT